MSESDPDGEAESTPSEDAEELSHGSIPWKVLGETDEPTGAGVLGHNTSGSGTNYGVMGQTDSSYNEAAGVYGKVIDGTADAVRADSRSGGGHAIRAVAESGAGFGYGIWVTNWATSGAAARAIYAETKSADSAAVVAENDGTNGQALQVDGWSGTTQSGSSFYQSSSQSVPNDDNEHRIEFDTVEEEDLGTYDTNAFEYNVIAPGVYHVDLNIVWSDTLTSGTQPVARIKSEKGGTVDTEAHNFRTVPTDTPDVTHSFSTTVRGLSSGDKIWATMDQDDSGGNKSFTTGNDFTHMQVTKIA